ncbi:AI-2E family transporter [Thiothrix subterranea]|uniref:AI-2E family transporter n=1 Tax=Thiothrix subterranea TaxID=2735563 RepID=UPI00280B8E71|nr:AI-2E family transporter [Thiothrix subterranea]
MVGDRQYCGGFAVCACTDFNPFFGGGISGLFGDPLVDRLESWKLSRTLSVVVVFVTIFLLLLLFFLFLVPVLETQTKLFINKVPNYLDWVVNVLGLI